MSNASTQPEVSPVVGMHGTICYFTDRYPCEVIEVPNARTVVVREMTATRTDAHGMSACQSYEYSSNANDKTATFTRRRGGQWIDADIAKSKDAGRWLILGAARRYHDYSF